MISVDGQVLQRERKAAVPECLLWGQRSILEHTQLVSSKRGYEISRESLRTATLTDRMTVYLEVVLMFAIYFCFVLF